MKRVNFSKKLLNKVYIPYIDSETRLQIFYGGSSSGKSSFILNFRIIYQVMKGGRNFLVVRQTARSNRNSTFMEVTKGISRYGLSSLFTINKSEMTITCQNGYIIYFLGLDDTEKIKSISPPKGVISDIIIEEASEVLASTVPLLFKRLRGKSKYKKTMTLMFNPISKLHWIFKKYFMNIDMSSNRYEADGISVLKTTYRDNAWLEKDDIYELENEKDEYYRAIFTDGDWGSTGDVVFDNWEIRDLSGMRNLIPEGDYSLGLDFGFIHPAGFIKSYKTEDTIFVFAEVYEKRKSNQELAELIRPHVGNNMVYCDSAEPKSISELREAGINARGVPKKGGSRMHGYRYLRRHKIVVDPGCHNLINELTMAQWLKDKNGDSIEEIAKVCDDAIDGLRYSLADQIGYKTGLKSGKGLV